MSRRIRSALFFRSFVPHASRFFIRHPAKLDKLRRLWLDYNARFPLMAALCSREVKAVERMFYDLELREPVFRELRGITDMTAHAMLYYVLVRLVVPDVVVETGVANGASSRFILEAMERNRRGILHSIDLPNQEYTIGEGRWARERNLEDRAPGWLVPPELRERWHLHLGDSQVILPKLLSDLGEIDIFIHDSKHTYEHMCFEYETAWPHVKPGGFLLSDDVNWNGAFADFASRVEARPVVFAQRVGGLRKRPAPSPIPCPPDNMRLHCFICASPFWPDDPVRDQALHVSYLTSQIQSVKDLDMDVTVILNGCEFPTAGLPWIRNPLPKNVSYNLLVCDANCRGDYWIFLPEDCLVSPVGWQAIRKRADRECFALSTDPKAFVCRKGIFQNLSRELYSLCDMNFLGKEIGCLLLRGELERRGFHCITPNWKCVSENPKRWGNELYEEMNRPEAPYNINDTRRLPTLHDYGLPGYRASVPEIEETFVTIVQKALAELLDDARRMKGIISKFGPKTTEIEVRE